jgi:peptidoglycan/LPS O-acetylase OafA/YrhL
MKEDFYDYEPATSWTDRHAYVLGSLAFAVVGGTIGGMYGAMGTSQPVRYGVLLGFLGGAVGLLAAHLAWQSRSQDAPETGAALVP